MRLSKWNFCCLLASFIFELDMCDSREPEPVWIILIVKEGPSVKKKILVNFEGTSETVGDLISRLGTWPSPRAWKLNLRLTGSLLIFVGSKQIQKWIVAVPAVEWTSVWQLDSFKKLVNIGKFLVKFRHPRL